MQLNQFEYLIAVDRYGSISKAAQELYVSQSTISLALINLEKELNITILTRGKRGVSFTSEGKEILEKIKSIMAQIDALCLTSSNEKELTGIIKIGGSAHFSMSIITDMIIQIRRQYPKLDILTRRDFVKEIIKKVSQKELDLGVVSYNTLNQIDILNFLNRSQVEFMEVFQDKLCVGVGEEHPLRKKKEVYIRELCEYDFISLSFRVDESIYRCFQSKGYQKTPISVNDVENMRRCASDLNGFIIIPGMEFENGNKTYQSKLYPLNLVDFDVETHVGLVRLCNNELSYIEKIVVEQLERECQRYVDINNI